MLVIAMLCFSTPSFADEPTTGTNTVTEDKGGMFERAIAAVFDSLIGLVEGLERSQGLKGFDELVFNKDKNGNMMSEDQKNLLPFTQDEWNKLNTWYNGISVSVSSLALVAVVITAFKLMGSGKNPSLRSEAMDSAWRWIWALLLIPAAPIFVHVVFVLNTAMVDTLWNVAQGVITGTIDDKLSLTNGTLSTLKTGSVLGTAIVKLAYAGIGLYLNFVFMLRKYALIVIFVFTPIMVWMWAINKNVNAAMIWMGEIISNAFLQSAYALVFLVFLTFTASSNWLSALIWAIAVIPLGEMIRNSVQGLFTRMSGFDEAGTAGRVMGFLGLGSVMGAGKLASATAGGGSKSLSGGDMKGGGSGNMALQGRESPSTMPPMSGQMSGGISSVSNQTRAGMAGMAGVAGMAGMGASSAMNSGLSSEPMSGGYATTPSGLAVPSSRPMSGGYATTTSGLGVSSSEPLPGGYATTPSGLAVPSSDAQNAWAATQQSQEVETMPEPIPEPGAGLSSALEIGNKVGNIAAKTAGVIAGVAMAPVPGGEKLSGGVANVVGGISSAAATTVALGVQTKRTMNETGYGVTDSIKYNLGVQPVNEPIKLSGTNSIDDHGIRR